MNEFVRGFLNENWPRSPDAPRVFVGAFGKHPGWNDHLDDIGLVTASLVRARRVLYEGITHQIETAAWEKAGPERVLPGFDHVFHWRRAAESLTGRMWSSQDGKGRALYPMIIAVHAVGASFGSTERVVLQALDEAVAACRATTAADAVIRTLHDLQAQLRRRLPLVGVPPPVLEIESVAWAGYVAREPVAIQRVLHHLRHQLGSFAPGTGAWGEKGPECRSRSLRVPGLVGARPAESLDAWISFLQTQLDPAVPILGLLSLDGGWCDLIVGEPAPPDLFVVRARTTAVPLVTDIPYRLEDDLAWDSAMLLAEMKGGAYPRISLLNHEPVAENRAAAERWLARNRARARRGFLARLFGKRVESP